MNHERPSHFLENKVYSAFFLMNYSKAYTFYSCLITFYLVFLNLVTHYLVTMAVRGRAFRRTVTRMLKLHPCSRLRPPVSPKFESIMEDLDLDTGETTRLAVVVEGKPDPDILWYKVRGLLREL